MSSRLTEQLKRMTEAAATAKLKRAVGKAREHRYLVVSTGKALPDIVRDVRDQALDAVVRAWEEEA